MMIYLIKTVLCSALFLLMYKWILEREKMYRYNRFYLLASVVLSFLIPLIEIEIDSRQVPELAQLPIFTQIEMPTPPSVSPTEVGIPPVSASAPISSNDFDLRKLCIWFYGLISGFLFIRFSFQVWAFYKRISRSEVKSYNGAKLVFNRNVSSPFTFGDYIFVNPLHPVDDAILCHELAHAHQHHTVDKLFLEFIQIFCWFNPLLIFYKRAIMLNHEYLADESVLQQYDDVTRYQTLLIGSIRNSTECRFSNNFNFLITKKRLIMMTKHPHPVKIRIKQFCMIPICSLILIAFCNKNVIAQNRIDESPSTLAKTAESDTLSEDIKELQQRLELILKKTKTDKNGIRELDSTTIREIKQLISTASDKQKEILKWNEKFENLKYFDENGKQMITPTAKYFHKESEIYASTSSPNGASAELIAEYNGLIPRNDDGTINFVALQQNIEAVNRLREIYKVMSMQQRKKQSVYFIMRKDLVRKKTPPTQEQFEALKDPKEFGVWLNGKKIDNSELNKYKYTDIGNYISGGRLMKNAKDYGKYKYHVWISSDTTPPKFESDTTSVLIPDSGIPILNGEDGTLSILYSQQKK